MDLDQLRVFARVAELGSFTQAADQLGLKATTLETRMAKLGLQRPRL